MRQACLDFLACSAMLLFLSGCVAEPGIEKGKFAALDRTAQDLRTALTSSAPCAMPEDLQQRLASGIADVRDKAASKGERDLTAAYAQLLATYQDGMLLCRSRDHLAGFQLFPKGRIYVTQELDPLVRKYGLPTEKHLYERTGQYLTSVDESSIQDIWDRARRQIKNAENILHYH
jgi:hypothetical protein